MLEKTRVLNEGYSDLKLFSNTRNGKIIIKNILNKISKLRNFLWTKKITYPRLGIIFLPFSFFNNDLNYISVFFKKGFKKVLK